MGDRAWRSGLGDGGAVSVGVPVRRALILGLCDEERCMNVSRTGETCMENFGAVSQLLVARARARVRGDMAGDTIEGLASRDDSETMLPRFLRKREVALSGVPRPVSLMQRMARLDPLVFVNSTNAYSQPATMLPPASRPTPSSCMQRRWISDGIVSDPARCMRTRTTVPYTPHMSAIVASVDAGEKPPSKIVRARAS